MSYEEKRAGFAKPAPEYRPIAYLELPAPDSEHIKADILREMAKYSALGCQAVIPQLPEGTVLDEAGLAPVREMYEILLAVAEETGMKVGFHLDPAFEHAVVQTLTDLGETALCAKMLDCREYLCTAGEKIDRPLHAGELLSLVAFSEENDRILDLRGYIREGRLVFEVPDGNWVIREYLALPDTESGAANYLSYEASYRYISAAFSLFERIFTPYLENGTLSLLSYSEIGFNGKNRRNWDASFNTLFRTRFGFDPAPYYPRALYLHRQGYPAHQSHDDDRARLDDPARHHAGAVRFCHQNGAFSLRQSFRAETDRLLFPGGRRHAQQYLFALRAV